MPITETEPVRIMSRPTSAASLPDVAVDDFVQYVGPSHQIRTLGTCEVVGFDADGKVRIGSVWGEVAVPRQHLRIILAAKPETGK